MAGELILPPGTKAWDGDTILFDEERWPLRPGDLVGVDLSRGETPPGLYLPLDAIMEKSGDNYVFAVTPAEGAGYVAQKIDVKVFEDTDIMQRVEALGEKPLQAGMRIIVGGAHYLRDGERVNIAEELEMPQ